MIKLEHNNNMFFCHKYMYKKKSFQTSLFHPVMYKSKSGLGLDLDLSPIFIENGLDLNIPGHFGFLIFYR